MKRASGIWMGLAALCLSGTAVVLLRSSGGPQRRDAAQVKSETLRRWCLFGLARSAIVGELVIESVTGDDMKVRIGEREVLVGSGVMLSESETERVRSLAGRKVVGAVGEWLLGQSNPVLGATASGRQVCIGPIDDWTWAAPAAAFRMLREDDGWTPKALAMEGGIWASSVAASWRPGNEVAIAREVRALVGEQPSLVLARDIVGWFLRTIDSPFPAIQPTIVSVGSQQGKVDDLRMLAVWVLKCSLGVPRVVPIEKTSASVEFARTLWILTRMVELAPTS